MDDRKLNCGYTCSNPVYRHSAALQHVTVPKLAYAGAQQFSVLLEAPFPLAQTPPSSRLFFYPRRCVSPDLTVEIVTPPRHRIE